MGSTPNISPEGAGVTDNPYVIQCRDLHLDCTAEARVVGILNVTPDSFSDGGQYMDVKAALRRAAEMIDEGACAVDVGGASSRPRGSVYGQGAMAVSPEEEMRRVMPVIREIIRAFPETVVSVDTYHPDVARAVLEAGAHMINDITGLRFFPEMAKVIAGYNAALVVMHAIGRPGEMVHEHVYSDVVSEVRESLELSVDIARSAGVKHIVIDPGFGLGRTASREQGEAVAGMLRREQLRKWQRREL